MWSKWVSAKAKKFVQFIWLKAWCILWFSYTHCHILYSPLPSRHEHAKIKNDTQKSILRNFWHSAKACHTFEEKARPNKQVPHSHLYGKYTFLWCTCSWTKTCEFWPYVCPNMPHSWITNKRIKALTFARVRNFNNHWLERSGLTTCCSSFTSHQHNANKTTRATQAPGPNQSAVFRYAVVKRINNSHSSQTKIDT